MNKCLLKAKNEATSKLTQEAANSDCNTCREGC